MPGPLAGLKVLELARVLAGPWAGQVLADLGAEVTKVESPRGDDTRDWGPPFVASVGAPASAAYFHSTNRGKRSIVVDFAKPAGQEIIRRLAGRSDVLIENFKVGALRRRGLDFESLAPLNPRLVYCSITGFGQDGPAAGLPGYDFMIQAASGLMDITGAPDGPPQKMGVAFVDMFTGLYAVIAIQAALAQRERSGRGQHIDLALMDTAIGVLGHQAVGYLASGNVPARIGNAHPNIVPYQTVPVRDGYIVVTVGNDTQFAALARVLDMAEIAGDPRFATNAARVENRAALTALLEGRTRGWTAAALLAALAESGVPAGPVQRVDEALADPQVLHRQMVVELARAAGAPVPGIRTPILMSDADVTAAVAAPELGADTAAVLAELGYPDAEVAALEVAGVTRSRRGPAARSPQRR